MKNQLGITLNEQQRKDAPLGAIGGETKAQIYQNLAANVLNENRPLSDEIAGNRGFLRAKRASGETLTSRQKAALELYEGKTVEDIMIDFKQTLPNRFEQFRQAGKLFSFRYGHLRPSVLAAESGVPATAGPASGFLKSGFSAPVYLVGGLLIAGALHGIQYWRERKQDGS